MQLLLQLVQILDPIIENNPHTVLFPIQGGKPEIRRVPVPPHRFTPLKENWMKIFTPVVEHLKLQMRLNLKTKSVEIKVIELSAYQVSRV